MCRLCAVECGWRGRKRRFWTECRARWDRPAPAPAGQSEAGARLAKIDGLLDLSLIMLVCVRVGLGLAMSMLMRMIMLMGANRDRSRQGGSYRTRYPLHNRKGSTSLHLQLGQSQLAAGGHSHLRVAAYRARRKSFTKRYGLPAGSAPARARYKLDLQSRPIRNRAPRNHVEAEMQRRRLGMTEHPDRQSDSRRGSCIFWRSSSSDGATFDERRRACAATAGAAPSRVFRAFKITIATSTGFRNTPDMPISCRPTIPSRRRSRC